MNQDGICYGVSLVVPIGDCAEDDKTRIESALQQLRHVDECKDSDLGSEEKIRGCQEDEFKCQLIIAPYGSQNGDDALDANAFVDAIIGSVESNGSNEQVLGHPTARPAVEESTNEESTNEESTNEGPTKSVVVVPSQETHARACNEALKHASGEYVYFLDEYSSLNENALEKLYLRASAYDIDTIALEDVAIFDDEGRERLEGEFIQLYGKDGHYGRTGSDSQYSGIYSGRQLFSKMQAKREYCPLTNVLVKRSLLEQNGMEFCMDNHLDKCLWMIECLAVSTRVMVENRSLSTCTIGPDSKLLQRDAIPYSVASLALLDNVMLFVKEQGLDHGPKCDPLFCSRVIEYTDELLDKSHFALEASNKSEVEKAAIEQDVRIHMLLTRAPGWQMRDEIAWRDREREDLKRRISEMEDKGSRHGLFSRSKSGKQQKTGSTRAATGAAGSAGSAANSTSHASAKDGKPGKSPRIIASITTFPLRIDAVQSAIQSVLDQTLKPDAVTLWLAESQFPEGQDSLPNSLLQMQELGLTIEWCEDIRSYKRLICAMEKYPDDLIVTFDDDLLYPRDSIEALYSSWLEHPNAINALRTHRITFEEDGSVAPYASWKQECNEIVGTERMDLMATNGAGTLYPPHCLPDMAFDREKIREIAPTEDDCWSKFMQVINDVPVVLAKPFDKLVYVPWTQEASALWSTNQLEGGNDLAIRKFLDEYGPVVGGSDKLVSKLKRDL